MSRKYHIDGSVPTNQIFVFGSNQSGIHGAGAARAAHKRYGAVWGVAEGRTGDCYAIPTVKKGITGPLSLSEISHSVERFISHAASTPDDEYLVTRIGCVLAGHSDKDIAPMFANAPSNCSLPITWKPILDDVP